MRDITITYKQFEEDYAKCSCITVKELRELGRFVKSCDCGEAVCKGWQMAYRGER